MSSARELIPDGHLHGQTLNQPMPPFAKNDDWEEDDYEEDDLTDYVSQTYALERILTRDGLSPADLTRELTHHLPSSPVAIDAASPAIRDKRTRRRF